MTYFVVFVLVLAKNGVVSFGALIPFESCEG